MKIKKECVKTAGIFAFIIFCTYIAGTRMIQLPGLYFDAVYPDYLAAIGAFPSDTDNFTQITRHNGLPLLGNFHHGTLTAAVQWIILKITRYAGVETVRLVNLGYISTIGCLIYLMLRKALKNNILPVLMAVLCVTAQNSLTISRTQFYIMLPGCILFLISAIFLIRGLQSEDKGKTKNIFTAGLFQGFAFYGYFSFLFLALGSLFFLLKKEKVKKIYNIMVYIWGIICGSILYFWGYYDSLVTNLYGISEIAKIVLIIGCMAILLLMGIPVYILLFSENLKAKKITFRIYIISLGSILIGILAAAGVVFWKNPDKIQDLLSFFQSLQTRNKENLLLIFWNLLYQLLTNERGQIIIFQESFNIQKLYVILSCIAGIASLVFYLNDKKKMGGAYSQLLEYIGLGYLYLVGFYIGTLPLIKGMQPQHFVIAYFGMFIVLGLETGYVIQHIPKSTRYMIVVFICVVGITVNIYDIGRLTDMLKKTEGRGKYNVVLDEFAEKAYTDPEKTEKIYVFPEWGFNANFIYLTRNSCQTIRDADIDVEELQKLLDRGYTLIIAAFQKESVDFFVGQLEYEINEETEWESIERIPVFFSVEVKNTIEIQ